MAVNTEEGIIKTVLEMDLASYSDIAIVLESISIDVVKAFEDQIQEFVNIGLKSLGLLRDNVVLGTAGDNAILLFDDPSIMHQFANIVHKETLKYNKNQYNTLAQRWFRMGAATGKIKMLQDEKRVVGTTITRAVRLESSAEKGQLELG